MVFDLIGDQRFDRLHKYGTFFLALLLHKLQCNFCILFCKCVDHLFRFGDDAFENFLCRTGVGMDKGQFQCT